MQKKIAHVVVGLPVEGPFDYLVPEAYRSSAQVGMRVQVSFARKKRTGIIVGFAEQSAFAKLNPLLALLDESPVFSLSMVRFAELFALRFGCTLGEAFELCLPKPLRGAKKLIAQPSHNTGCPRESVRVQPLGSTSGARTLIFDPGQEKRWDTLLPLIKQVLAKKQNVICAVPDATYLPTVRSHCRKHDVATIELSQKTDKDEFEQWQKFSCSKGFLAVGFISAVLTPAEDVGLIVIMDEERSAYKHDQSPFYHAREAAFLRSRVEGSDVVLVSSTPSFEAWKEVEAQKLQFVPLQEDLPPVKFLDLKNFKMKKGTYLSSALRQHLERIVAEGKRALLFIQAMNGVEGVVQEVSSWLPNARIAGYDRVSCVFPKSAQIVVATTSVLRVQHAEKFDITVVLDIDWEFHKVDHRAVHGALALTRYLRQMTREFILLQTRNMENEQLHAFACDDVAAFYRSEMEMLEDAGFPPFGHLVALVVRSAHEQLACDEAQRLYDGLSALSPETVVVHEPQADRASIVRGKHRWCVMVQGLLLKDVMAPVKNVLKTFRGKKDTVVTVNVDP